jgi:hypothetical protein
MPENMILPAVSTYMDTANFITSSATAAKSTPSLAASCPTSSQNKPISSTSHPVPSEFQATSPQQPELLSSKLLKKKTS